MSFGNIPKNDANKFLANKGFFEALLFLPRYTIYLMRYLFSLFLLALSFSPSWAFDTNGVPRIEMPPAVTNQTSSPAVKEPTQIRLATWNIEWFPAGQRQSAKKNVQQQMQAVSQMIEEFKPDLLFTQETRNLGALVSLNKLLTKLGFTHIASARYDEENQARMQETKPTQNTGVLSRYPWQDIWEADFQSLTYLNRPARGHLGVKFEISGVSFVVYDTHTKSNFGASNPKDRANNYEKRVNAVYELKRDWERLKLNPDKDKIIIVGDFNTDIFAQEFKDEKTFHVLEEWGFKHCFGDLPLEQRVTLPGRKGEPFPDGTFDYIWFSKAWGDNIPTAQILSKGAAKRKEVYGGDEPDLASDHYPVFVDIVLKKTDK